MGPPLPDTGTPSPATLASVMLLIGVIPSPLKPTMMPSSQRDCAAGRNPSAGKVFAKVTPALAAG